MRILFLHHSTGRMIWNGGKSSLRSKILRRVNAAFGCKLSEGSFVQSLFIEHNSNRGTNYMIEELEFPKTTPYGWRNYPFDYYNIWVKNAGSKPFLEEPTLEMLAKDFDAIIFKHCFPVSNIKADQNTPDINSDYKSLANYKLQYGALREKLYQFPKTKFIVWTGAARVKSQTNEDEAKRAKDFFNWVINQWDLPDDNIYIWDFYGLQTEGELYFKDKYARSAADSHPNGDFSRFAGRRLFTRVIDVLEANGTQTDSQGHMKQN